jgi:hypothetical protein
LLNLMTLRLGYKVPRAELQTALAMASASGADNCRRH